MLVRDTIRHVQPADVQAVVDVYTAADLAVGAEPWINTEILQTFLDAPNVDPDRDTFVVERDGRVIAYADCEFRPASGRGSADAAVHPDFRHQGIGTQLIRATEARILERAEAETPAEQPVTIQRGILDANSGALRLVESLGYRHIRTFYHMRIAFDQPVDAPPLPDGLTLRPFDPARDGRAVYEAHQEAFADHWGYERRSYDEWAHYTINDLGGDPAQWWVIAYDGDEVAGICLNRPYGEEDAQMGWVSTLGVRRPWRKRGLGLALLRHSFALFQERGCTRAGLGVDAASLTNAVALYERAGMHVHKRFFLYRKALRGTPEDEVTTPAT